MCLRKQKPLPKKEIEFGYKVLKYSFFHSKLTFPFYRQGFHIKRRRWLNSKEVSLRAVAYDAENKKYKLGFHVFTTLKAARGWRHGSQVIFKVKIRNIVAYGDQSIMGTRNYADVVVAREMLVLHEIEK